LFVTRRKAMENYEVIAMKKAKNRLSGTQADYIFAIVRRPAGWKPKSLRDVPPKSEIFSQEPVASFEEACEDLIRCNQLAMRHRLKKWAVILHPGSDI
jgi:hypothetical protein